MFFHCFDPNDPEEDPRLKSCLLRGAMLLAVLCIIPSLNYSGFCWSKMRYLSDEEKFRLLFEMTNSLNTVVIKTNNKGAQSYERIKYDSFEEFMEKNPNCFEIEPSGFYEMPPPKFIDRITGFNNGEIIGMNYMVRYLDDNGDRQLKKIKTRRVLQNCGKKKW